VSALASPGISSPQTDCAAKTPIEKRGIEVGIKVIVELQARPGRREEFRSLLESVAAKSGPSAAGFLGSMRYEVLEVRRRTARRSRRTA
jgi:hypothetical protein